MHFRFTQEELEQLPPLTMDSTLLLLSVHLNARVATLRQAAKTIGISEGKLRATLKYHGYVYKQTIWRLVDKSDIQTERINSTSIREALEQTPSTQQLQRRPSREQINHMMIEPTKRTVTLDHDTYQQFMEYCDLMGYFRSKALTAALKDFMDK